MTRCYELHCDVVGWPEEKQQPEVDLEKEAEVEVTESSRFEALRDLEREALRVDLASDLDLARRQNMSMLRIPFELAVDRSLRVLFAAYSLGSLASLLALQLGLSVARGDLAVQQDLQPFGRLHSQLQLSPSLFALLAATCDLREAYLALRGVVPALDAWLPLLTVDLSDEVQSLFVGSHIVPLADISEFHPFTAAFMRWCLAGGSFRRRLSG